MAFRMLTKNSQFPYIYNVEQTVGAGLSQNGDVKLVQYMLRGVYGVQASGLAIDGWIGPTTVSWIRKFQADAKARGSKVVVSGQIGRAFGDATSNSNYSILALNLALQKKNPAAYSDLPKNIVLNPNPAPPYTPPPNPPGGGGGVTVPPPPKTFYVEYSKDGNVFMWRRMQDGTWTRTLVDRVIY